MKFVEPKVYLLGYTKFNPGPIPGVREWLADMGVKEAIEVTRLGGAEAERLIELAGRRCYKSFEPGLNPNVLKIRTDSKEYHANLLKSSHGSVLANATSTWAFENVSRVFTHELVRNAVGIKDNDADEDLRASDFGISQESLRYVRLNDLTFWLPPEFKEDYFVRARLIDAIDYLEGLQTVLAGHFQMDHLPFEQKKKLTSALRRILPMGIGTGIVWTANLRALRWVIEQRTSRHAEEEFRLVFGKVGEYAKQQWPLIFQDFAKLDTNDGLFEWVPEFSKV